MSRILHLACLLCKALLRAALIAIMDVSKSIPATDLLSVHTAKDIFNLDATPGQFFSSCPSTVVFFSFTNHLFKCSFDRFCLVFAPKIFCAFFSKRPFGSEELRVVLMSRVVSSSVLAEISVGQKRELRSYIPTCCCADHSLRTFVAFLCVYTK
jgi:hypothetical protein